MDVHIWSFLCMFIRKWEQQQLINILTYNLSLSTLGLNPEQIFCNLQQKKWEYTVAKSTEFSVNLQIYWYRQQNFGL